MKIVVLILAVVSGSFIAKANETFSGKVVRVVDGNTVEVMTPDKEIYKIKLYGINCPELGQNFGVMAKDHLEKMLLEKTVIVNLKGKDRWGTRLGSLLAEGEIDPRNELLKEGLAWTTEVNPDAEFEAMKKKARESGNGLWKEKDPTPPWTFRRQQTMAQVKSS